MRALKSSFRGIYLALVGVVPLLTGGCTSFDHDWEKSARQNPAPDDLQGRWQGTWISQVNGHTDTLRCVITKKPDGIYSARFLARYHKVLSFGYTVGLKVQNVTNKYYLKGDNSFMSPSIGVQQVLTNQFRFSGDANLGWLKGGIYHYEGHASATNYFSTYSCKYDHGTFQMERPINAGSR